jgi:hypothetical protein
MGIFVVLPNFLDFLPVAGIHIRPEVFILGTIPVLIDAKLTDREFPLWEV